MTVKGNPLDRIEGGRASLEGGRPGLEGVVTQPPSYDSLGYTEPVNSVSDKVGIPK